MNKKVKKNILIAFSMILFVFFLFPFVLLIINSGKTSDAIIDNAMTLPTNPLMFIDNIKEIFANTTVAYVTSFISSLIITIVSLIIIVIASSMCAWAILRNKRKLSYVILTMFLASMVVPFQVVMFPLVNWYRMVETFTGIGLLRTYSGIILAYGGFGMALSVFLFHGFMKSIPVELEEAAEIDGCNQFQIFFKVVFPILRPITVTVSILNGIWIWNDFLLPIQILGGGNKIQTLPIAMVNFIGSFVTQWNLVLTTALLTILPVIVVYLILQKQIIKGMVAGAVK